MERTVYVNSPTNGNRPPWEDFPGGWIVANTQDVKSYANTNKISPFASLNCAVRRDEQWVAFYRWDAKKGKFICTRYRDYIRRQEAKKQAVICV